MKCCSRAAIVFLLAATAASVAAADTPKVVPLYCDTLVTAPYSLRIWFAVRNESELPICSMYVSPGPDGEEMWCGEAPTGWKCSEPPTFSTDNSEQCILPGETSGPFAVTTTRFWFHVLYVIFWQESASIDSVDVLCDAALQAYSSTWGRLKAVYR